MSLLVGLRKQLKFIGHCKIVDVLPDFSKGVGAKDEIATQNATGACIDFKTAQCKKEFDGGDYCSPADLALRMNQNCYPFLSGTTLICEATVQ